MELERNLTSVRTGHPAASPSLDARELWIDAGPGRDLTAGTREYHLFEGLRAFLAVLDLPELFTQLSATYDKVRIQTSLIPYFALFDKDNYRLITLGYRAGTIDIAYGLYQAVLDTEEDEQFYMLILSQLLELLNPGITLPDSTTAALTRDDGLLEYPGARGLIVTESRFIEQQLGQRQIRAVLLSYLSTGALTECDKTVLRDSLSSNLNTAALCGISAGNIDAVLSRRLAVLTKVYHEFRQLAKDRLDIPEPSLYELWDTYFPVSDWIIAQAEARRHIRADEAYVLGMCGPQGSGKTTISAILNLLLGAQGYMTAGFSIDDIYKTHKERQQLRKECPHYRFRGPPGTHDVDLGLSVMRDLRCSRDGEVVRVPVFGKSRCGGDGDRVAKSEWRTIRGKVAIVIFEGWCVGAQAVDAGELERPVNDIEGSGAYDDSEGTFRRRINTELKRYDPLFRECDDLMVLSVPNLANVYRWRELQERKLRGTTGTGMGRATVRAFVDYYMPSTERYVSPLARDSEKGASLVLAVGDDHGMRGVERFEHPRHCEDSGWPAAAAEESARAVFRNPQRGVRRNMGTAVIITDGVGLAPLDHENPLFYCSTPHLDALASPRCSEALRFLWHAGPVGPASRSGGAPCFAPDTKVICTAIHAASEELGLKQGQPGDSCVGHSSLAMGAYVRKYIGVIWDAIRNHRFHANEAIVKPIEHVLAGRGRYAHPKLHIWGMCSRGYIHSDIDILYEILRLCRQEGLRQEDVVIHVVTDGKDVPRDTAGEYVKELEETLRRLGVGVIGTICGRDGWMCNRDARFVKDRNGPAARCVISAEGILPDAPSALEAIGRGKESESGRKYGNDIDRFLEPTHIKAVRSSVEPGDAMICFNLREDRSVLFPRNFIFPLADSGRLRDFVYSTLIELRSLARPRPYHFVGFRQLETGERASLSMLRAGFVVRTFAESEKGDEVSKAYVGGHIGTAKTQLGTLSPLLQIDPDEYPTSPRDPYSAPEMKAAEVRARITGAMDGGVAIFANLCNGDVIGHYGVKETTKVSMSVVDGEIGRIIEEAGRKGVILMITSDHGCVEAWGPMHTANLVPFAVVFPPQQREQACGFIVGAGVKALTDVEPTRFMLLGIPQPAHITGDSILIPDVSGWSDGDVVCAILTQAAKNNFALLRRCPDRERIRRVLNDLTEYRGRQLIRMFSMRLEARLMALARAECPFLAELWERVPADLFSEKCRAVCRQAGASSVKSTPTSECDRLIRSSLPVRLQGATQVVTTTTQRARLLVSLEALRGTSPDVLEVVGEEVVKATGCNIIAQGAVTQGAEQATARAQALGATTCIVRTGESDVLDERIGWHELSAMLREFSERAERTGLRLLIENSSPRASAALADAARIRTICEELSCFGVALNVQNALEAGRVRGDDELNGLRPFFEDNVLRSHIEAVRIPGADERGESIVRYLTEQGRDVTVIVERSARA